ncbi:MAG: trehalose-phosphatase [Methylovirgula sp.]|nr:trehalose-phosphatase [Methylovirgula sp.]
MASRARPRDSAIKPLGPEAEIMDDSLSAGRSLMAPAPARNWALFLDLDGTLLDIAATPSSVVMPPTLVRDLQGAARALNGALAIVSGRALGEIDRLLHPLRLAGGSEHGAVIRLPDGTQDQTCVPVPPGWVQAFIELQRACPGVLIEAKPHNLVAHFRHAPAATTQVRRLAEALLTREPDAFELLEAKMAIEIRPRAATKARPVHRLMELTPFAGRYPVFVGDDVTDEDGFAAARAHGGLALDVATYFGGEPQDVRHWLKRVADL